jgi:hypothetical protein
MPGPPAALACHQPPVMARLHCDSTPYRRSLDVPLAAGPYRDDLRHRRLKALAVVAGVPASAALLPAGGGVSPCGGGGRCPRWRRVESLVAGVWTGWGCVICELFGSIEAAGDMVLRVVSSFDLFSKVFLF